MDGYFREIVESAATQGWSVERTRKGHWKFTPPPGCGSPVFNSGTPSDYRSVRNFLAKLRRNGFRHGREDQTPNLTPKMKCATLE